MPVLIPDHVADALRILLTYNSAAAEAAIRVLRGDEARSVREQRRELAERIEARRRELYRPVEEANQRVRDAKDLPARIEAEMYADQRAVLPDGRPDDPRRSRGWDHHRLNTAKADVVRLRKEAGRALATYRAEMSKLMADPLACLEGACLEGGEENT